MSNHLKPEAHLNAYKRSISTSQKTRRAPTTETRRLMIVRK
jgi:hypothetical protein